MLTQAKEEQRRHLGEVGGVVGVDAEEGRGGGRCLLHAELQERRVQGQGGPAPQGPQTASQVGGPALGCKAPAGSARGRVGGGAGKGHARVAKAGGGKLQEAEQRAQEAERQATAAEREWDLLRAQARKPKPKPGQQQEVGGA